MGLAVTALTACSDDYTDWAAPQSNPQEPARTVSFAATAAAAIDYNSVKSDSVQLFKPSITASSAQKSRGYQSRNQDEQKANMTQTIGPFHIFRNDFASQLLHEMARSTAEVQALARVRVSIN